ncbi:tungsten-containing aldehyde:ferredoxin oxidoreductase [hydrocarbon metagenome]|uniref:Tungsten-containing aldehyde:ferredoxin oxidoreductase n=1 Tax=hydrocarbon metagenome TaxID=938273 RepID=A0A0W8FUZ3_9ZZZZ
MSTGKIETRPLDEQVRDFFIGGRGLGLYLLHKKINAKTTADDAENPLIFSPGPLGGIPQFPGTSKCMAISLSPLTHIPGVSNFGGHFGAYLKYAGFDALEITGISKTNAMIVIDDFKKEIYITEAPSIDQVFDLEKFIVDKFLQSGHEKKDIVFLTTGIGAANTTYGCINSHYYDAVKPVDGTKGLFRTKQAGRTGLGTVMINKNIRAIVVLSGYPHGENPYGAADWEKVKQAGSKLHKIVKEVDPQSLKMYRKGSAGLIAFMNKDDYKSLPVNNYQYGSDPRAGNICGKNYAEHIFDHRGMDGCFPGCNLRCTKGGWVTLTSGEHKGKKVWVDGPEYETAAGFGSNLGMWNPEFIMEANWHCDNYGIDTITTAVIMAFVMECYQRGYLIKEDTDGFELKWGDEPAALQFIHDIAYRKTALTSIAGLGMLELINWIGEKCADRTGKPNPRKELEQFAMQAKGLPFSLYRTHRSLSMQGSYAVASDIGAHHAAAWLIKVDLLGAFPTFEAKARALITYPRVRLGNDNLGLCKLPWVDVFNPDSNSRKNTDIYINPASQEIYADFYNGMLGTNMTWEQIFEQTDRDINLQRIMNMMTFDKTTGEHDWIPDRAIGPTEDILYENEKDYNDGQLSTILNKPIDEVQEIKTSEKREILMKHRKKELKKLISVYYAERGWNETGIPKLETLKKIGLWNYLSEEAKEKVTALLSHSPV